MTSDTIDQYVQKNFSEWIPLERVGLLHFDKPLPDNLDEFEFRKDPDSNDPSDEWDNFKLYDMDGDCFYEDLTVTVEDNNAIIVSCDKFFYYKKKNIIGSTIQEALQLLGNPEYETEDVDFLGEWKTMYEIDELELSIWVKGDIVEGVACYGDTDE